MDIRGFQVWLSAARGLARCSRCFRHRTAIELGVDEARRCPHCAKGAVSRGARGLRRYQCKGCGRTFNALSIGLTLAVVRGVAPVKASAARCDRARRSAGVTGFWRRRGAIRRCSRGSWKRTRPTSWRAGRARAGWDARHGGGAARRRARPLARAGAGSWRQTGAEISPMRRRSALDPVVAKDALLVSDGGASYPPCAAALGVHSTARWGNGFGAICMCRLNSRHSRLKDFLRPRRGIATRYLDNLMDDEVGKIHTLTNNLGECCHSVTISSRGSTGPDSRPSVMEKGADCGPTSGCRHSGPQCVRRHVEVERPKKGEMTAVVEEN